MAGRHQQSQQIADAREKDTRARLDAEHRAVQSLMEQRHNKKVKNKQGAQALHASTSAAVGRAAPSGSGAITLARSTLLVSPTGLPDLDDGAMRPLMPKRMLAPAAQFGTLAYYIKRLGMLESERATWYSHHREIAEHFAPRRWRGFWSDRNRGVKRNDKIINSTGPIALRTCASGMHSGLTSPARPWFRLTTPDPALAEFPASKRWLHYVEEMMRTVLARSNLYNLFPQCYADMAAFGTCVLWIDEDPHEIVRGYCIPSGSYMLGGSANQTVDTFYRRVSMPVAGCVDTFGYERCGPRVRGLYDKGDLDAWILLGQGCEPNRFHDSQNPLSKAWISTWFELEGSGDGGGGSGGGGGQQFLRQSGYHGVPFAAARWNTNGEDIYGFGPGMDALGDQRALQQLERRKLLTGDKIVNPAMMAPASLRGQHLSMLPGDFSYLDGATPNNVKIEPVHIVNPQAMQVMEMSIREHEQRVKSWFYSDLWMLISNDPRGTPATAEEIRARESERMLQVAPVIERVEEELLDPVIDRVFEIMLRRGMIPPPPPELQRAAAQGNAELRIEYISILAQAAKAGGTVAVDRLVGFSGNMAKLGKPEALDLLDADKIVREYGGLLGTNPELLLTPDKVAEIRQQRAQQQQAAAQQQQQMMAAQTAAHAGKAAQALAAAPLNDAQGPTALNSLLGTMGPQAVQAAGQPMAGNVMP